MAIDPRDPNPEYLAFWTGYHFSTLTTHRPDGTPHVVPVGVTYDPVAGTAWVTADGNSKKVRNVLAAGEEGALAAVCQVIGSKWATLEGRARVRREPEAIEEAVRRYSERYRPARVNPNRVLIEITLTRAMGNAGNPPKKAAAPAPRVEQAR
ncbi:pyridoxamine 5'-phosphate oxidase family protein [Streptomyces sp. NPDC004111]|uniref:pyridoxamine 5'-phosphate oxidase family protein n=1 Tax=Streptomyces sp. NPDC004111 TaxID=3364690 RepID=UPI0036BF5B3B